MFRSYIGCVVILLFYTKVSWGQNLHFERNLNNYYASFQSETLWSYGLKNDNTYVFQTRGHFGNTTTKGMYRIKSDTIILIPYASPLQENPQSFFNNWQYFFLESDSCIIDLRYGQEYHVIDSTIGKISEIKDRDVKSLKRNKAL